MSKQRNNYTSKEKVLILKQHLLEQVPVSDLCHKYGLHPTVFYRWQKEFFEKSAGVFDNHRDTPLVRLERKVTELEDKVVRKDEVLSVLMARAPRRGQCRSSQQV
jgi:transposase